MNASHELLPRGCGLDSMATEATQGKESDQPTCERKMVRSQVDTEDIEFWICNVERLSRGNER